MVSDENQASMLLRNVHEKYQAGDFATAIQLFTKALEDSETPSELKRTILTDRAQTYIDYGDIYTSLRDLNLALSPEHTLSASSKVLTAQCYFCRAQVLCKFARFDEAHLDIEQFKRLCTEEGSGVNEEQTNLSNKIDEYLNAPQYSQMRRKAGFLRAIDSRGIIVQDDMRSAFLLNANSFDFFGAGGWIDSTIPQQVDRVLADPNTRITVGVYVRAPFFNIGPSPEYDFVRYHIDNPMGRSAEEETVSELLFEVFSRAVMTYTLDDESDSRRQEVENSAIEHDDPNRMTAFIRTYRGRILVIPWESTFADIFAGARWPRDTPVPFKDLSKIPSMRDFESDGLELDRFMHLELHVIPNYELDAYIETLNRDFPVLRVAT